jgi:hypothetical protein
VLVNCLLVSSLVNHLTDELRSKVYMRSPAAATCSFGCWNGMPANGQAVLCVDPIVIHAKPFQSIQSQLVNRQTVYCGPNSDVYSSTNVRMFIPQSFDNLFGI